MVVSDPDACTGGTDAKHAWNHNAARSTLVLVGRVRLAAVLRYLRMGGLVTVTAVTALAYLHDFSSI